MSRIPSNDGSAGGGSERPSSSTSQDLVSLYRDFERECAEKHLSPSPGMFTLWLEVAQGLLDQPGKNQTG